MLPTTALEAPCAAVDSICIKASTSCGSEELPALRPGGSLFTPPSTREQHGPAKPQLVNGVPFGPEFWGISRSQVSELLQRLRSEPAWDPAANVYQMVVQHIVPWTRGQGNGYALMINAQAPREVNVMVSHAWAENAEEFLETVLRSTSDVDVLFICALSLYQPEDGAGPTIAEQIGSETHENPFRKVLSHISANGNKSYGRVAWQWHGILSGVHLIFLILAAVFFYWPVIFHGCFATFDDCLILGPRYTEREGLEWFRSAGIIASVWDWNPCPLARDQYSSCPYLVPVFLALGAASWFVANKTGIYRGRMLVVPNHEVDLYSRLWCVFEIYTAHTLSVPVRLAYTLASAGCASSSEAQCASAADAERIRAEIVSTHTYDDIDRTVYLVTHAAQWEAVRVALVNGTWLCIVSLGSVQLPCAPTWAAKAEKLQLFLPGFLLVYAVCAFSVYFLFARIAHGRPSRRQVMACAAWLTFCGAIFRVVDRFVDWPASFIGRGPIIAAFYMAIGSLLAPCLQRRPRAQRRRSFQPVLALLFLFLVLLLVTVDMLVPSALEERGIDGSLHFYPIVAKNVTGVLSWFSGPAYLCWSASVRWGVKVRP